MADLIKKIKIKKQDGTFTDYIPIGADAVNVSTEDGDSVQLKINKKPYYYDTVADMKADIKLKAGDMAITLGYYEPNDGGRAEYKISNDDTLINDGGSVIDLNNGLKAKIIVSSSETINIIQLGYLPNIPTQDCHNAIDVYISLCKRENRRYNLFIPGGKWFFSETDISNGRFGVTILGEIENVAQGESNSMTMILPFNDIQEYIWNLGDSNTSTSLVCGNVIKNMLFTTGMSGWKGEYKRSFCKTALLLTYCCYSYFDGLYFSQFKGSGLTVQMGWENYFGFLNFRGCGCITPDFNYPALYFKAHPIKATASGVSANYFEYINFEGIFTCIYMEDNSQVVHSEINNIQVEWSAHSNRYGINSFEYLGNDEELINWNNEDSNIEHIGIIKGQCAEYLTINTITVSTASFCTYHYTYIVDNEEVDKYCRLSGIILSEEHYIKGGPGPKIVAGKVIIVGNNNFPVYYSLKGTSTRFGGVTVNSLHGTQHPIQINNIKKDDLHINIQNEDLNTKNKYYTRDSFIIYANDYISRTGTVQGYFDKDSLNDDKLYISSAGSISYSLDGKKDIYFRIKLDYENIEDFPEILKKTCTIKYDDGTQANALMVNITKTDIENNIYPLNEWFDYKMYETIHNPFGRFVIEMALRNNNPKLDCIKQSLKNRESVATELLSQDISKSPKGTIVYCTDRRKIQSDELGILLVWDGTNWKTLDDGTTLDNLVE